MKPATSTGDLLRIIVVSLLVLAIGIIVAGILGDLTMRGAREAGQFDDVFGRLLQFERSVEGGRFELIRA